MAINTIIVLQVQNYRKSPSVPGERRIRVSYPRPIVLLAYKKENGILEEADNALFRTKQRENRVVAQLNVVNGEVVIRSKEPRGVTLNGRELSIDGEPAVTISTDDKIDLYYERSEGDRVLCVSLTVADIRTEEETMRLPSDGPDIVSSPEAGISSVLRKLLRHPSPDTG